MPSQNLRHPETRSAERVSEDASASLHLGEGGMAEAQAINVTTARNWLADGAEIAFLDLREEGPHADGHPLLAVNAPYSRLELDILRLVPRKSTRILLADGNDGV